jgi:hypothetical protein
MKIELVVVFVTTMILSSCTALKITNTWKAQDTFLGNYKKILVLGLIRNEDRRIQEKMENHFVSDLQKLGYNAVSSLQEYGPKFFDKMEENEGINKLRNSGFDAVVTIVLLKKIREEKYNSPIDNSRIWSYRNNIYNRVYEPGYYVIDTKYFWESNFYEMASQKLLYSVQTQCFNMENAEILGHEYGKMIVKNLVKQHMISKQNE